MSATPWTTPDDLRQQVQRYWDSGRLLAAGVKGVPLFPLELRLRGPDTRALSERFEEVRQWIRELESESRYRIEWREVNHRLLGRNRVPARIVVPGEREALELIGKTDDAARFRSLAASTLEKLPELAGWLARRPLTALEYAADWDRILTVLLWFREHPRCGLYLRQLDIARRGHEVYRKPEAPAGGTARYRIAAGQLWIRARDCVISNCATDWRRSRLRCGSAFWTGAWPYRD